jgi:beta-glucosidase-like glycosyl hydrolase
MMWSLTETVGWIIGREMAAAGANLDFAPVVDIVDNPENSLYAKAKLW